MNKLRKDSLLTVTRSMPAAAASNASTGIDLGYVAPADAGVVADLVITVPALPALVEDKTITITVQDSADNSSFTAVSGLSTLVITGGTGNGAAATSRRIRLPSSVRRYVGVGVATLTAGGDNTGVSLTLTLET